MYLTELYMSPSYALLSNVLALRNSQLLQERRKGLAKRTTFPEALALCFSGFLLTVQVSKCCK